MTDDNYKDMVISHDKHIDSLTTSVQTLADGIKMSNKKLDNVLDVLKEQNVLAEKIGNMDKDVRESFGRVHKRVDILEKGAREIVAKSTVQWFVGFLLAGILTLLTFIGSHKTVIKEDIHKLDTTVVEMKANCLHMNTRIKHLEDYKGD